MDRKKYDYIILLTDFGQDSFVGTMKGVIKSINPRVEIIDLTHNIQPQNIVQANYVLFGSYNYFPSKSIFVCVVDPGVGTKRNIIIVDTGEYLFIAPDNGLLTKIIETKKIVKIYKVVNKKYFLKPVSYTFHGRDIFAPVSAYISKGVKVSTIAKVISINSITKLDLPKVKIKFLQAQKQYLGRYIFHDHFGNIITNLENKILDDNLWWVKIKLNNKHIKTLPLVKNYSAVGKKKFLAIPDSYGFIEIAIREGNAYNVLSKKYKIENLEFELSHSCRSRNPDT